MTTTTGWASELAQVVSTFISSLAPASAGAALLGRGIQLRFNGAGSISLPTIAPGQATFIGQGKPIPVVQFVTAAGVKLEAHKLALMTTLTREMIDSSNDEQIIRAVLSESAALGLDTALFGATAATADAPAASLQSSSLVNTDFTGADLTGCHIHGVSAWGLKLEGTKQQNLVITHPGEPEITVDNIEVAQFVYLLLHNEKIRDVIDTIGKKGVLLLGRFTEGRMVILERLREKLRGLGYVPMVFNFDKPETKDFSETVRLLCGLSKFVIVDITNPRSAPLELQATVPDYMVPFAPILQQGESPFAMFVDLQNKYDWVLDVIAYPSVDRLAEVLEETIVRPAEAKFNELLERRTKQLRVENV